MREAAFEGMDICIELSCFWTIDCLVAVSRIEEDLVLRTCLDPIRLPTTFLLGGLWL